MNNTSLSAIENGIITIRGEQLLAIARTLTFPEAIFFLLLGRRPTEPEKYLFEKILLVTMEHGPDTTSSATSRFVISGGNDLNVGVGGGILSIGDFHGGAIEPAMRFFYQLHEATPEERRLIISQKITRKEIIFGFGHKLYKEEDPRVTFLRGECRTIGYLSPYFAIADEILQSFKELKGRTIPLNVDGCIAALLCTMNVDARLGKGIFIIARTPGLVANCYDELLNGEKVRRTK